MSVLIFFVFQELLVILILFYLQYNLFCTSVIVIKKIIIIILPAVLTVICLKVLTWMFLEVFKNSLFFMIIIILWHSPRIRFTILHL